MNIHDLQNLSEAEFDDELNERFGDIETFRVFLDPSIIRRTAQYLRRLRDIIDAQLVRYGGGESDDPTWESRTHALRARISSRLHEAQYGIREMDAVTALGDGTSNARKWRAFAHQIIEVILKEEKEGGAYWPELDEIPVPFGDLSARQWVARRLEKNPKRAGVNA